MWVSSTDITLKVGVNPEILKNSAITFKLLKIVYKSIHFWNGNESENPCLISNLTKNDFLKTKWQKNHFFGKKSSWTAYKTQF